MGSRAICWSKRTLEILHRLGCADRLIAHGVSWQVGRVFFGAEEIFSFDLQPEAGYCKPPFINLQQSLVERLLLDRLSELPPARLRRLHKVTGVSQRSDGAMLQVATPAGLREFAAEWLIAADGSRSAVRKMLGLDTQGQAFRDRFLITDVRMKSAFPAERWFWFDPPFHRDQSALLHRQADNVWRIDLQLGPDAHPEVERTPERIMPRLRAMLGPDAEFEIGWASVYTFQCRRLRSFRHDRTLFVGDAAHLVSPFGARGANSGIQDVDNLVWKLASVLRGTRLRAFSIPMIPSAVRPPTRTSCTRPARPISSRRRAPSAAPSAMPCSCSRSGMALPAGWSTADVCRSRLFARSLRSTRATKMRSQDR